MKTRSSRGRRIAATEARQRFSELLRQVREDEAPVVVEKGGVPVAAIVPLRVLEQARRQDEERAQRAALLADMRAAFREETTERIEVEALRAVRAVRRTRRGTGRRRA